MVTINHNPLDSSSTRAPSGVFLSVTSSARPPRQTSVISSCPNTSTTNTSRRTRRVLNAVSSASKERTFSRPRKRYVLNIAFFILMFIFCSCSAKCKAIFLNEMLISIIQFLSGLRHIAIKLNNKYCFYQQISILANHPSLSRYFCTVYFFNKQHLIEKFSLLLFYSPKYNKSDCLFGLMAASAAAERQILGQILDQAVLLGYSVPDILSRSLIDSNRLAPLTWASVASANVGVQIVHLHLSVRRVYTPSLKKGISTDHT